MARIVNSSFDELIDSYLTHHIGISENFLGRALSLCLGINLELLLEYKMLSPARTGNDVLPVLNTLVRGDKIYWLDRAHNNAAENLFFDLMDRFVAHLNRTCFTGITGYEFHYTLYEPGSFYKKHIDQFKRDGSRQYSMVMYLNEDWLPPDGGQLCVYQNGSAELISPVNGKSVFFKSSELEHEVLLCNKARMSITGWLKT